MAELGSETLRPDLTAETLRSEFDRSFALPLVETAPDTVDLVAIRIADRAYALASAELGGLMAARRLMPLPSPDPALGGLVGLRGALVAAFDLGVLLGLRASAVPTRWLALSARDRQLALSFDELDGYLRVPRSALCATETREGELVERVLVDESCHRPVAGVDKIAEFLSRRASSARSGKAG
ncbi:MAG TPA: chemotaxis protein CheW [Polyangiaceae bacterium]|nr:chemotaxis protein CheW [Polyangiaceae bacterium]